MFQELKFTSNGLIPFGKMVSEKHWLLLTNFMPIIPLQEFSVSNQKQKFFHSEIKSCLKGKDPIWIVEGKAENHYCNRTALDVSFEASLLNILWFAVHLLGYIAGLIMG